MNFLPPSFVQKNRNHKIKAYKVVVVILWISCLVLFIIYTFQQGKNKILNARHLNNSKGSKTSIVNVVNTKDILSITTFRKFLINLEKNIPYKTLSIDGKRLNIELIIDNMLQYYEIADLIENKYGYKILYLSSPFDINGTLHFKMLIEVI
jgi:hypothetical protein